MSGMSEQEFGQWQTEQERFMSWNTDHLSQLLAHHHIDHTRYDGTRYSYVPNIPDLGVQQGVNFMSGTPGYSTAPSPSASQFANVPKLFKKNDVPRKTRTLTVAEETIAAELANSINTYAEWGQKLKGPAVDDPAV
ncbi:hypothetical protein Tco_0349597 [Tanacetum coccineum]